MRAIHLLFLWATYVVVIVAGAIHVYAYTANTAYSLPWLDSAAKTLFLSFLIPAPSLKPLKKDETFLG